MVRRLELRRGHCRGRSCLGNRAGQRGGGILLRELVEGLRGRDGRLVVVVVVLLVAIVLVLVLVVGLRLRRLQQLLGRV